MDGKKTVLVVSANLRKAYPVIESVSKMGLAVIAAFYVWRSSVFSKHIHRRYLISDPYTDEHGYVSHIRSITHQHRVAMIIPVGFIDSVLLAKHRKLLPRNIVVPIPSYEAIMMASDKVELVRLCKEIGVKYPRTLSLTKGSLSDALRSLGLPLVVKGGSDASTPQYAFTTEQLKEMTENGKGGKILQEFISGGGAGYFALVKNGEIIAEYAHNRIIEEKPSGGPSLVACISKDPEIFRLGRKIIKQLSWTGALMVEFKRDYETGEYYILEINPKLWGSLDLAVCKRIDFPRYIVETFLYDKKPDFSREAKYFLGGCFAWILSGMNYLKENPMVWFRILKHYFRNGAFSSDMHLGDPTELAYSFFTRIFNSMFRGYGSEHLKENWLKNLKKIANSIKSQGIGAIVFDFDGTIVNLKVDWNKVRKELVKRKLIRSWESIMVSLYQARQSDSRRYKTISSLAEKYENEALEKIEAKSSLKELFSRLLKLGVKMAVVSKQTSQTVVSALKKLGIHENFGTVVGREYSMSRKEQLARTLEDMKVSPGLALMVEDTVTDATSAARLHMTPVGITRNPYRFQQFVELGVPTFSSIDDCIKSILVTKERCQKNEDSSNA